MVGPARGVGLLRRPSRLIAVLAVAVLATAWAVVRLAPGPSATAPRSQPEQRLHLLATLSSRLVPSAGGGWVVADITAEPAPDRWLLAVAATGPTTGSDASAALDALVREGLDDRGRALTAAVALASVEGLPDPGDAVARQIRTRAEAGLASGQPEWLSPLLALAAAPGAEGALAARSVARRAGHHACDRLPEPSAPLPPPGADLVVALRALATASTRCATAGAVLDRVLHDPRWAGAGALPEVTDLVVLASPLSPPMASAVAERLRSWALPPTPEVADLSTLASAPRAWRALGRRPELPDSVLLRLNGLVAQRGRLADRIVRPPTAIDVAVLRQLAATDLVPGWALDATEDEFASAADSAERNADETVAEALLLGGRLPSCGAHPTQPQRDRVTLPGIVADEVGRTVAATCDASFDLPARTRALLDRWGPDQESVRIATAILTVCALQPVAVTSDAATAPALGGALVDDPVGIFARSVAVDPVGACEAARS